LNEAQQKSLLRQEFLKIRAALPAERKTIAAKRCLQTLLPLTANHSLVFSYASFKDELDTTELNTSLAQQRKLVLSVMQREGLRLFLVHDYASQVRMNSWGLPQPIPELCREIYPFEPTLVLIPALAFDYLFHRLGYGHGMYDRLLKSMESSVKIGLGYEEQYMGDRLLPSTEDDVCLTKVYLF
jgi:5-formyltetrahydrofolate cyclo-ligase